MTETFVLIYHPALNNVQVSVSLSSVDDHAARGWLLVDPGVTPPAPTSPYITSAALVSQITAGAAPVGTALRAALVPRPTGGTDGQALVKSGTDVAWGSAGLTGAQMAVDPTVRSTFAPSSSARPGNLFVFLGDSITAGADDTANQAGGVAWPVFASIYSGQRVQYVRNAGIGGNTTAAMLARFDTDVTPYAPTVVTLACGTNDTAVTPFADWRASFLAIVAKIRAIGAVPVLATMPPNNNTTPVDRRQQVNAWNTWIKRYAAAQGLTVLDFYSVLVDPANGNFKAAYNNDGTHPNPAGTVAMGKYAADVLTPLVAGAVPYLPSDDGDETSILYGGCFTGGSGSTLPSGWSDAAGTPSGSVLSYTTDAAVPGQLVTITQTAAALRQLAYGSFCGATTLTNAVAAGATSLVLPIRADFRGVLFIGTGATAEVVRILSSSGAGPQTETLTRPLRYAHAAGEPVIANAAPGDELVYAGLVTSDGALALTASVVCQGGSLTPAPMSALTFSVTRGVFQRRFTVPAGTTSFTTRLQVGAGTGVASFGRVGLYNLTRLGALT